MNTTIKEAPVKITPSALKELKDIKVKQELTDDHGIRIGVKGGGCSGFTYVLGFDLKKENDEVFQVENMTVFMEKGHGLYLLGMEIDWIDGLENRGFSFNNPNATETCGCGTSFSA